MTEECRGMWTGHSYCRNAGSATATKIGPRSSWLLPNEDICHHRELPSTGNEHASQAKFRDSMSVCTHAHTHMHAHKRAAYTYIRARTCMCTDTRSRTCTQICTRTHVHTHTDTVVYVLS